MFKKQWLALGLVLTGLAIFATISANCQPASKSKPWAIKMTPKIGSVYPDFDRQFAELVLDFAGKPGPNKDGYGKSLVDDLRTDVQNKSWDCSDANNYHVTYKSKDGKSHPAGILFVDTTSTQPRSCSEFQQTLTVRLQLAVPVQFGIEYDVEVMGIKDSQGNLLKVNSDAGPKPTPAGFGGAPPNSFDVSTNPLTASATAQSILNEPLSNGSYKGVEQFTLASTFPFHKAPGRGAAWFGDTKNLISTNELDKKSSFMAGAGYEWGPQSWYIPVKLEQAVQGNQIATSLSAVSSLSVGTVLPWAWTSNLLENKLFQIPLSPDISLAFPYTHRINQALSGKAKPLPTDDFSVNPTLALKNGVLLPNKYCSPNSAKKLVCFGLEADLGMYYLPLETTSKGSQRAEGYGDVSFLVPLSDFSHFPFITLDAQSLASQLRIEYSDAVTPASNYARTKKWSFGIELIGKK